MIYRTATNISCTRKNSVLVKGAEPLSPPTALHPSHSLGSAQEVTYSLTLSLRKGKAPPRKGSKDPVPLCHRWTSAFLLVFNQKGCVLPSTGDHHYCTVLQLFASHLHRAPLIVLLPCAKLQVGAHAPGIHGSWKHSKQ